MEIITSVKVVIHHKLSSFSEKRNKYCELFLRQTCLTRTAYIYPVSPRKTYFKTIIRTICFLVFALIVFYFGTAHLFAATYYVDPSGNDNNPGDDLMPFRTLQKAANLTLPGDVVVARNGVYTCSSTDTALNITRAGSSSAYITFKSENPNGATIDCGGTAGSVGIVLWDTAAYIKIEGFEIRNCTSVGIYGWGNSVTGVESHDIVIANNIIHHNGNVTVTDPADWYGRSGFAGQPLIHHYTFEGNTIYDNGRRSDSAQEHAYRHDHGLYLQGKYMTVRNNIFYNHTAGWAIKVDGYWGDEVGNSENSHVIVGNMFRSAVRSDPNGGGYIRFYNNRSYNEKYGYMKPPKNVLIENNSFYKPTGPATDSAIVITDGECCNYKGTVVKNNITTSSHLYSENLGTNIRANVTAVDNSLNAADLLFAPNPPTEVKIID